MKEEPKMAIVHRIPKKAPAPKTVPDNKRPLNDRGLPGGLPPAPVKPGWRVIGGNSVKLHTHS
jgi:hypothetical protein